MSNIFLAIKASTIRCLKFPAAKQLKGKEDYISEPHIKTIKTGMEGQQVEKKRKDLEEKRMDNHIFGKTTDTRPIKN